MDDGIPDSLRSLVDPNVRSYDPNGNNLTMREQMVGTAQQWRAEEAAPKIYGSLEDAYRSVALKQQVRQHDQFLQTENQFNKLQDAAKSKAAKDIRDMTMNEFAAYRREVFGPQTHKPMGVSLRTGSEFMGTDYNTHPKSPFDLWKDARDKYITGELDDLNEVLKYVREGEDGYSKIVDMEIAEERALKKEENDGVHQHRLDWRRWPFWRWLATGFHR